jgi:hypothetical protein
MRIQELAFANNPPALYWRVKTWRQGPALPLFTGA